MALADIINTITEEAEAQAKKLEEEADAEVQKIETKSAEDLKAQEKENEEAFKKERENRISSEILKAKMRVRATDLEKKRELINSGLDEVLKKMEKISSEDYTNLVSKLLEEVLEEGFEGEVIPAKGREAETKKALQGKEGLTPAKTAGKHKGGVIIKSKNAEIDASFEHLVQETYKPQLELIISKEIFN